MNVDRLREIIREADEIVSERVRLTPELLDATAGDDPEQMLELVKWLADKIDIWTEGHNAVAVSSGHFPGLGGDKFIYRFVNDRASFERHEPE